MPSPDPTLTPGARLGPYEILAPLGAGGMGEVFRSRDTRLDRIVAVKTLPSHLSESPVAIERFDREARAISALNHPNVCQLYDVGSHEGIRYLVMEYLDGETLADRLTRGPLPLDQVVARGIEICEGLAQAHAAGVVHRDLKPGNIMLTRSGLKLMDFGLAKPCVSGLGSGAHDLLTRTRPLTMEGALVGTVLYMSPEQVGGQEADWRSDIFAVGAILYEMLCGRRAFEGKSQLSVASAILEKEPESLAVVQPLTPPALEHVIRTCLAKDPDQRWQSARDLAHALAWVRVAGTHAPSVGRAPSLRERLLWAAVAVCAAAAVVLGYLAFTGTAPVERVTRAYIRPMADSNLILSDAAGFALSPNGRYLAFVASTPEGRSALWVRPIGSLRAEALEGTNGATYPFWSPDSESVAFFAGAKLKKIAAEGGPTFTLCDAPEGRGGAWNRAGEIVFAPSVNTPLHRVSANGGVPAPVTTLDRSQHELSHRWPAFLPDDRHFLFLAGNVFTDRENPTNTVRLGSLDAPESPILFHSHAGAVFASGRVLYLRQDTLMAQPFDMKRVTPVGSSVPIADPVKEVPLYSKGLFSASDNGLLAYVEGLSGADREMVWLDRSGRPIRALPQAAAYACPRLSPDGKRLLYYLDSPSCDVWAYDLTRGVTASQTFGSTSRQSNVFPVWSPDGRRIAYSSYRDGMHWVFAKLADGSSQETLLVTGADQYKFPTDWSPDGKLLVYQEGSEGGWGMWLVPVDGSSPPRRLHDTPFSEREASFSPDGRWLVYSSSESGEFKVYVVPFPGPGEKRQVSSGGGGSPRWRRDGREIFYLSSDNKMMAVDVRPSGPDLELGTARALFEARPYGVFGRYDVSADGQQFVLSQDSGKASAAVTLVVNWPAELRP